MGDSDMVNGGKPPDEASETGRLRWPQAILIENETAPDELAIYDITDDVGDQWIVASGTESFVSLDEIL